MPLRKLAPAPSPRAAPGASRPIAALIAETAATNAVDFGGGDVAAVYAETTGYCITGAPRDAGLAITRRR
jgi:hypothetical protein